jgi:hypothetical protein
VTPSSIKKPVNRPRIASVFGVPRIEDVIYRPAILDPATSAVNGFFDAVSLGETYTMLAGRGAPGDGPLCRSLQIAFNRQPAS